MTIELPDGWRERDTTKICWRLAHAVIRERDRGWPGVGPAWKWLCSDTVRDRPREQVHR